MGHTLLPRMKRRLVLGPILILALLGLMWLDVALAKAPIPPWLNLNNHPDPRVAPGAVLLVIGILVCARAGYELARMFRAAGIRASARGLSLASAAGVFAAATTIGASGSSLWAMRTPGGSIDPQGITPATVLASVAALVLFLTMLAYIRHRDAKGAATAVAAAVFAFVYVGVTLGFLMALRREFSIGAMVAVVLTVKSCDIGAYFTGTAIGRHKLIPWLSPGKTWEGLVGGLALAAAVGGGSVLAGEAWWPALVPAGLTWWKGALLGAVLGGLGQAGDLSASVLKRDAGVKDAGRILPGFGGMVDILDSLLIAAPVAYLGLRILSGDGIPG